MPRDLQRLFRVEARELLGGLATGLDQLARGGDGETLKSAMRLAHTLKGAARVAGHADFGGVVHELEGVLPSVVTDGAAADRARHIVHALGEQIDRLERGGGQTADGPAAMPATAAPPAPVSDAIHSLRVDIADLVHFEEQLNTIRVELMQRLTTHPELGDLIADVGALQASFDAIRLVPSATIGEYLERTAADAAAALHKEVTLRLTGGELRIELHVLVAVRDALVQAVRNAVAHGVEDPAARVAAGKPRQATIDVEIEGRGSTVTFRCRDDGRGVDVGALRRALVAGGRLSAADERAASDDAILDAAMRHGVTSRTYASAHAGRGVGLDIIRNVAARLRGRARVTTTAGIGTTVEIVVPAAVSSITALRVASAGSDALLPLHAVRKVVPVTGDRLDDSEGATTLIADGRAIPFVSLATVLRARDRGELDRYAVLIGDGPEAVAVGTSTPGVIVSTLARRVPALAAADPVVAALAEVEADILPLLEPRRLRHPARAAVRTATERRPAAVRVLVVDDSVTTRTLEQSILESAGYEVETAASAEEALEMAKSRAYSLLLVDVEMPGMNGFQLLEAVRATPAIAGVPAIMVTSRDAEADRRRAAEVGAREYFVKSAFDQDRLLEAIAALVR